MKIIISILLIINCTLDPKKPLDPTTPFGTFYYLLPLFLPQIKPSDSKAMKSYSIQETNSGAFVSGQRISLTLPFSTSLESLTAEFFHTGKNVTIDNVEQISGQTKNDFTKPLVYRVQAQNSSFQDYTIKITKGTNISNNLISFSVAENLNSEQYIGLLHGNVVNIFLPYQKDPSNLLTFFSHDGKKVFSKGIEQISGKSSQNFSTSLEYSIVSESDTIQNYIVNVNIGTPDSKELKSIWLNSVPGILSGNSYTVPLAFGTNTSDLVLNYVHTGVAIRYDGKPLLNGESILNLTNPATVSVLAKDGSVKEYTIRVSFVNERVTLGGTIQGLSSGKALSIQSNGIDSITINSNGDFQFPVNYPNGSNYNVVVISHPLNQFCSMYNGMGTFFSDVNTVFFSCKNLPGTSPSFTDYGNGTVKDNNTGLLWMKCPISTVSGIPLSHSSNCSGTRGVYTFCTTNDNNCNGGISGQNLASPPWSGSNSSLWYACNDANTNVEGGFGGKSNWRVPSKAELYTIVNFQASPSIYSSFFPNNSSATYATSSSYSASQMFTIQFDDGDSPVSNKNSNQSVRCVSSP